MIKRSKQKCFKESHLVFVKRVLIICTFQNFYSFQSQLGRGAVIKAETMSFVSMIPILKLP